MVVGQMAVKGEHAKTVEIDQYLTIYEYFTKAESEMVSLVTAGAERKAHGRSRLHDVAGPFPI